MFALIALCSLAAIIAGAIGIRKRWGELTPAMQRRLLVFSSILIIVYVVELATRWHTTSLIFNEIQQWITVGSYTLLTLLLWSSGPRWLTRTVAFLLLLAVPLALTYFPLSLLFSDGKTPELKAIGDDFFFSKARWDTGAVGSSGTSLFIVYRPAKLPFLERSVNWVRFDDGECAAGKAFLVMQPDHKHVLARCPWYGYQHKSGYHDFLVPLS